ncbi:TonB-dependent receptor [Neolewinella aurantiaca]|uniref:TonB-dependent receptor n=1 Tax=Neolewinella aurantiaca TaxID=2602767 RepID=A0A5C7F2X4_9BACT|nr:carboxypeptidase regulatory-like domain-containing protein [Neolewinella aurantiaca]TXF84712.1 TonB-dependent receptor [Neolewinella aurantiaca]
MRILTQFLTVALLLAASLTMSAQGVTTASMFGKLTDSNSGEALIGATVQAVHTPSGTTYGNVTDLDGFFRLPGMRVGGPYIVTATYVGYEPIVQDGIYLQLGQAFQFSQEMGTDAVELTGIEVVANRSDIFNGKRTGQETTISEEQINSMPTLNRSIADFARLNPLAKVDPDGGSVSIAGQNNRFNSIYIDGAVNNDAFGLSAQGTNGGQTGVSAISVDAVEQFVVSTAPFDIRQSGFAGGAISAVTRSGTNNLEGSAYYLFRNEGLTRDNGFTTEDGKYTFPSLAPFSAKTYGARLGGAIVKDKVHFFINAEIQRDETPQTFDFDNYRGDSDAEGIQELVDFVSDTYGYNVGSFDNNSSTLNSEKIIGKLDFNLSQTHKLSVRHSYVSAENLSARTSGSGFIGFLNGSQFFKSTTNSSALELNSVFSNMANNLTVGATFVRDDRDPLGDPFPVVNIRDGNNGSIQFGGEPFSTANLLNQDVITVRNDLSIYKGRHNILIGANAEFFQAGNLFIRQNYGDYDFNGTDELSGLEQFYQGLPSSRFERSYSQVDNISGDESGAIANLNQTLIGFYVQDEYVVNEKLRVTGGLRLDVPIWPSDLPLNADFNNTVIPQLEAAGYDLEGAKTGQFIKTQLAFSPRIAFNYDIFGDQSLQLRGGVGIFTSRIPLVWPGGAYNNFGFNVGGTRLDNSEVFNPDVNTQAPGEIDVNDPSPSGQIDLFAENFKLPQTTKFNLALDYKLPLGLVLSVDALYTKSNNFVRYQRIDLNPAAINRLTGTPDNRIYYQNIDNDNDPDTPPSQFLDTDYTGIYLGTNTDKGYTYNGSVVISKPYTNGFLGTLGYSYGDSYSLFDGTSSQNSSQWRGYYDAEGRNNEGPVQRSTFANGGRIFGNVAYTLEGKNSSQTFSLFMNGQNGGFYTYVVGGDVEELVNDGGFDFNDAAYIPNNASEINLITDFNGNTPAEQYAALDAFINADDHLSDERGSYAKRNGAALPFKTVFDARFLQRFKVQSGSKSNILEFSIDVFNLNNLLNKEWGRINNRGFGTYTLVNIEDVSDAGVPTYTVNREILDGISPDEVFDDSLDDSGLRSSRWSMQLGVRYTFK